MRPIKVGLNPKALSIIEKWKNKNPENPYLLSILKEGLTAKTIINCCHKFIKWVNERMYALSEELGIEGKTSTYAVRHIFSIVLKRKGVPVLHQALLLTSLTRTK